MFDICLANVLPRAVETKSSEEKFYSCCEGRRAQGCWEQKQKCLEMSYFYPNQPIHPQVASVCFRNSNVYFSKDSKDHKLNFKKKFSWKVLGALNIFHNLVAIVGIKIQNQRKLSPANKNRYYMGMKEGTLYFPLNVNWMFPQKVFWMFNTSLPYTPSFTPELHWCFIHNPDGINWTCRTSLFYTNIIPTQIKGICSESTQFWNIFIYLCLLAV